MDPTQLNPLAEILIDSYLETHSYSRQFFDEHGAPPTLFAKVHHMRSIVQTTIVKEPRYELGASYSEFGRVEVRDSETGRTYLLRSQGALSLEAWRRAQRDALFNANDYVRSDTTLLVYRFHPEGLDLSIAGAERRPERRRIEASTVPVFVATWPYAPETTDAFEQQVDVFEDLGDLDLGDSSKEY